MRIFPFGGCFIHNPINSALKSVGKPGIFSEMGLKSGPFSLSANANHQLVDFLSGKVNFPDWVKNVAYSDFLEQPNPDRAELMFSSDVLLVGMSTPTELIFEGALLNINKFDEVIDAALANYAPHKKLFNRWRKALLQSNDEIRKETSSQILDILSSEGGGGNIADLVKGTYSKLLNVEDMTESVAKLGDRLGSPMAIVLYNFMFMPDGRSVQWPAGFKDDCAEVARRLDLPTFDFAPFVIQEGVDKVLMDDRRHWNPPYYLKLGAVLYEFCVKVADRSPGGSAPKDGAGPPPTATPAPEPDANLPAEPLAESLDHGGAGTKAAAVSAPVAVAKDIPVKGSDLDGPKGPAGPAARSYELDSETGRYLPDRTSTIYAVVVLGGAWANGTNADPDDAAVSEIAAYPGKALMFDAGPRPRGRDVQRFVDLRERGGGGGKETPCAGLADQIIRNSTSRFLEAPTMLFFSVSKGGTSLSGAGQTVEDGLLRGSAQHREVMRLLGRARDIAAAQKCRLEVAAICLLHGEHEVSRSGSASSYRRGLSLLQTHYDADIRALVGQSEPVRLYLAQASRGAPRFKPPELAMAQLGARLDNPYVQCVGPTYFALPEERPGRSAICLKASGYRRIGQLFGRFLIEDLWGAQREPLLVEEAYWVGAKTIRLRYGRPVGLEADDSRVNISDLGPGLGIDFHDGTPWSPAVEAVRLVRDQDGELDVELTAPSQGFHKRLLIAARTTGGAGVGSREGARSGIRSREPFDIDPLDGAELFDWACAEQVILS